jgi:hypothetical protein
VVLLGPVVELGRLQIDLAAAADFKTNARLDFMLLGGHWGWVFIGGDLRREVRALLTNFILKTNSNP